MEYQVIDSKTTSRKKMDSTKSGVRAARFPGLKVSMVLLALLVVATGFVRQAQAQIGGAAVIFLMIEPDSRSAGMGNTGVATADNAYAIFWNPAGLAYQRGIEAPRPHSDCLPELNAGLYYGYPVGKHHLDWRGPSGAAI